jgi:hypothetical protein
MEEPVLVLLMGVLMEDTAEMASDGTIYTYVANFREIGLNIQDNITSTF